MLEKVVTLGSILGMGFAVLFWAQSTFVDASDFMQFQYQQVEDEVNYLKDKEQRLKENFQELKFEDKRQLQRQELKLEKLRQQIKN